MKSRKKPSKEDQKIIDSEIRKWFAEYDKANVREIEAMTLWAMREEFGFGKKNLWKFYVNFKKRLDDLIARYQMTDKDMDWLCTRQLKEYGIDIEQWRKELDENEST